MGFIPKGTVEGDRPSLAAKFALHPKYDNGTNNPIKRKKCIFSRELIEKRLGRAIFA